MRTGGEYLEVPSNIFCLTVPQITVGGESFSVSLISGVEKVWIREGKIKIFRRKIFVSQCRKFRRGTFPCFTNFGAPKNFMNKRREGVSEFSVENFFSHSAENFRRGGCFIVSLISGMEKVWRRVGGVSRFSIGKNLPHSAEILRRETLPCFTNFGYRKSI